MTSITAHITEPVSIILTSAAHFYSNTNAKLKREKINQHSVRRWHFTQNIEIIFSRDISLAPSIFMGVSE